MKIYVAASFPRRAEARLLRDTLVLAGIEVTSRWLEDEHTSYGIESKFSEMDVEDVTRADCVVQMTGDTLSRGGRHTELGIALGQNKCCLLLGPEEQVFHHHPLVRGFSDSRVLISVLKGMKIAGDVSPERWRYAI